MIGFGHVALTEFYPALSQFVTRLKYNGPAPRRALPRTWTGNFYTPNGLRETARRRRQIEAGQLQVSA